MGEPIDDVGRVPAICSRNGRRRPSNKHNLNGLARASRQGESARIEIDINPRIQDLFTAIAEADRFIQPMAG